MSKDVIKFFDLPQCITADYYDSIDSFTRESIWQLCYRDLSHHKVYINSDTELSELCFNSQTVFPPQLQETADRVLETGKKNLLHTDGLTGKGVKVAVIDRPINKNHIEFKDRIEYIEVIPDNPDNEWQDFHGMTCAGFLAGSMCGTAPESELVYFAVPNRTVDYEIYSGYQLEALKKVIEYNRNNSDPIRVISLSAPFSESHLVRKNELANELLSMGCVLIDAMPFGLSFEGIDGFVKDDQIVYKLNKWQIENYERNKNRPGFVTYFNSLCFVPSSRRTSPGDDGDNDYIHWSKAVSKSWSIPHIAGAYACCLQVNPNMNYDDFILRSKQCPKHGDYTVFDLHSVLYQQLIV